MPLFGNKRIQFLEASSVPTSPQEGWAQDASRAKRYLYLPRNPDSDDRQEAAQMLLGYPKVVEQKTADGSRTIRYISRSLPDAYPFVNSQEENYLYATSIEQVTGLGVGALDGSDLTAYDMALYEVNYSSLPYDLLPDDQVLPIEFWGETAALNPLLDATAAPDKGYPDEGAYLQWKGWTKTRFISRYLKKGVRYLTLPTGLLMFIDANPNANNVVPWGFPFTQSYAEVRYVWHQVPRDAYPTAAINAAYGCVNDETFDGSDTGTLLFKDMDVVSQRSPAGDRTLDIQYNFIYLPNGNLGHNAILRSFINADGKRVIDYWPVTADGTVNGATPYRYASFAALFRPDQP